MEMLPQKWLMPQKFNTKFFLQGNVNVCMHILKNKRVNKGSRKKSSSLNGRAIKALHLPPPLGLDGHRTFFFSHKNAG